MLGLKERVAKAVLVLNPEKAMAPHSSTLAWKIPWTEELGAGYCPWGRKKSAREKAVAPHSLLPGKSHGWRSLVGCSSWGHTESDTTEQLSLSLAPLLTPLAPQ